MKIFWACDHNRPYYQREALQKNLYLLLDNGTRPAKMLTHPCSMLVHGFDCWNNHGWWIELSIVHLGMVNVLFNYSLFLSQNFFFCTTLCIIGLYKQPRFKLPEKWGYLSQLRMCFKYVLNQNGFSKLSLFKTFS